MDDGCGREKKRERKMGGGGGRERERERQTVGTSENARKNLNERVA